MVLEMWKFLIAPRCLAIVLIAALSLLVAGVDSADAKTDVLIHGLVPADPATDQFQSSKQLDVGGLAGGVVWSRHNLSAFGPVFQNRSDLTVQPITALSLRYTD